MLTLEVQPTLLEAADEQAQQQRNTERRKRALIALAVAVTAAALGYGTYAWLQGGRYVSTDNAYVATETAQVTPAIAGIVREVHVTDTQAVQRGDIVVMLDDTDALLALEQAEAELGRAVRRVRGYVANDGSLAAQIASRASEQRRAEAQLQAAVADYERAQIDLSRRQALAASGSVSGDELTKARNAHDSARAALIAAQELISRARADHNAAIGSRNANAAWIVGTNENDNPEVALARARRDQARVNLARTVIRAPVDGVIARRTVQVGQQVQAGMSLLAVVPLRQVHVDANFKEVQLQRVRIGQPVTLTSDLYGHRVAYRGTVAGLAGGTGSAFATIPAQNATGNWIKVVQRLPVRIALEADELAARPLQVGLSMTATIDTRGAAH
jgi:membrane fusion protein (multidrug efflux system)